MLQFQKLTDLSFDDNGMWRSELWHWIWYAEFS